MLYIVQNKKIYKKLSKTKTEMGFAKQNYTVPNKIEWTKQNSTVHNLIAQKLLCAKQN